MKAYYFVLLWLAPMISWVAFMFMLYALIPFGDLLVYISSKLTYEIGGENWDNIMTEIVIYGAAILNCLFIYIVAKIILLKKVKGKCLIDETIS